MDQARNSACAAPSFASGTALASYEPLEPRRLLAGIEAGVLVARGTDRNDLISLAPGSGGTVIVSTNSVAQTFDLDDFTGIRLLGLGGNDLLTVSGAIPKPITLNGGDGNDRLEVGPNDAAVTGGEGRDNWVYAGSATALDMRTTPDVERLDVFSSTVTDVTGNDLDNTIHFQTGRSVTVRGGAGADLIEGGSGHDRIEGGDGDDTLWGDFGNDTLVGNAGNDLLDGGLGDDLADGGPGQNRHVEIERFAGGGTPGISIRSGILIVTGTANADNISIERWGIDDVIVRVNSVVRQLDMDDFGNVRIRGFQGNDTIRQIDPLTDHTTFHSVNVEGDEGNDTLAGARALGGDGDDTFIAIPGGSQMFGEAGDDFFDALNGEAGDDIRGGDGTDVARIDGGDTTQQIERVTPDSFSRPSLGNAGGVLIAWGTDAPEQISIERTGMDNFILRLGALSREFDFDDFEEVQLVGARGDDTITVRDPVAIGGLSRRVLVDGGIGFDTLIGSTGDEYLFGGVNDDRLIGGGGQDYLEGWDGDDFLDARDGDGNDDVSGGSGSDSGRVDAGDNQDLENVIT